MEPELCASGHEHVKLACFGTRLEYGRVNRAAVHSTPIAQPKHEPVHRALDHVICGQISFLMRAPTADRPQVCADSEYDVADADGTHPAVLPTERRPIQYDRIALRGVHRQ
jgi:hypothetical protein